ncbi:MAG: ROK family protein [Gracilimonas sp.]|uniref:ROK family protein n=1 Tax=Gracilimonas sp. TaxID=1974203 RepID=UPI001B1B651C|nr:ROK family protein [Gracilimonas sp.]MBO6584983.1 ROK family protein [Gracilimonas sp.]MBO6615746.1 ROK family protein [Gracilimonas sp.]
MKAIGVDLGGTNIKAAVVDDEKGIVEQVTTPTQAKLGKDHILNRIAETIGDLNRKYEIIGIGMGLPGMVSKDQTTVKHPPNLPGWTVVNAAEEITQRTGIPCKIENDANIAAIGSLHFGVGRNFDSFIMITLGTGVGGGIIIDRNIYKGTQGMAGELGHVIIDYHGPLSNSVTRGTVEAYLGQRFLSRFATDLITQNPSNELYEKFSNDFEKLEPIDLTNAAKEGNELAIEILAKSGQRLGYAIINYVHMMDIRKIVVSGGVSKAGDFLFEPARDIVRKHMMEPFKEGFELVYEDLGNDSALLGAAGLAFDSFS